MSKIIFFCFPHLCRDAAFLYTLPGADIMLSATEDQLQHKSGVFCFCSCFLFFSSPKGAFLSHVHQGSFIKSITPNSVKGHFNMRRTDDFQSRIFGE